MSTATQIVLLDQSYNFLNLITIKKCIKLMVKGKVEVIKESDKQLRAGFLLPTVIRLIKHINITLSKKIPFSKQNIFVRDDYKCQYCGKQLNSKNATVDHINPQAKGGKNSYLNCVCSCKTCNQWKADKHLHETSMQLYKKPVHPTFMEFMYLKAKSFGIDMKEIFA
jgi:5-methylcytosine-specific restriction endonuclease McrA